MVFYAIVARSRHHRDLWNACNVFALQAYPVPEISLQSKVWITPHDVSVEFSLFPIIYLTARSAQCT